MPVSRGRAPVQSDAKPGAVLEGKTANTSSAKAPPAMSLARLGSFFWSSIACTKEDCAPSHPMTMALGGGWVAAISAGAAAGRHISKRKAKKGPGPGERDIEPEYAQRAAPLSTIRCNKRLGMREKTI
jgi:hypothetical protein